MMISCAPSSMRVAEVRDYSSHVTPVMPVMRRRLLYQTLLAYTALCVCSTAAAAQPVVLSVICRLLD
jgi:hypothetical protein